MGLVDRIERKLESTVGDAFARMFGGSIVPQEVESMLHREADSGVRELAGGIEEIAIFIKRSRETDIDALILRLDSFADAVTEILFARLLPASTMPGYGSAIANPTLNSTLPIAMAAFRDLRTLRSKSITAIRARSLAEKQSG